MEYETKKKLWRAVKNGLLALVSAILGALTQSCTHIL